MANRGPMGPTDRPIGNVTFAGQQKQLSCKLQVGWGWVASTEEDQIERAPPIIKVNKCSDQVEIKQDIRFYFIILKLNI